jgi:hypothetical protein
MAPISSSESGRHPGTASFPLDPALAVRFAKVSRLCAASLAVIGLVVLSGWLAGSDALKSIGLDAEPMKANTALGLLAAAVCLAALASPSGRARHVATAAGLLVLLDGAAHLCVYVLGVDLGIDQALFHDAPTVINPGRMAPNTAIAFVLCGCSAMLSGRQVGRCGRAIRWPLRASR